MKTVRMMLLVGATLAGVLAFSGSPASAQIPCPEGMGPGTTHYFTYGNGEDNTGLAGTPRSIGIRCTKDGTLVGISSGRVGSDGTFEDGEFEDPFQENDPCAGGWRYAYFVGGYFYCSKDGKMTYYLNA